MARVRAQDGLDAGFRCSGIDGHEVGYCGTCRGLLADNATFGTIVRLKRSRSGQTPHVALPFAQVYRRVALD